MGEGNLNAEDFMRYLVGIHSGKPVVEALLKISDPIIVKQVLCASIDTWCTKYGEDPIALVNDMADAMLRVHSELDEEEDEE